MNTCLVWGSTCRMSSTSPRKIVGDRDGGLVLAKRCVAKISLIDGREQERRVGKELLSVLAREDRGGAGDRHDEVRLRAIGEGGPNVVDDRLFWRADRPCRAHDDLNEVHGLFGALVQFDAKVRGEVVENQVAAVERLQHQDLLDRLGCPVAAAPSTSKPASTTQGNLLTRADLAIEAENGPHQCFALCKDIHSPVEA